MLGGSPLLLVIFGAGASFDSASDADLADIASIRNTPERPPLAKDLVARRFDSIATAFQISRPVIDRLRIRMRSDDTTSLETELARIAEESLSAPERRMHLMAFRFYLHRVIHQSVTAWLDSTAGFTHYVSLLNAVYDWHRRTGTSVRLATFNYDVMLDTALRDQLNWLFADLSDYIERDDFKLFKLHGSTNWSRVVLTGTEYYKRDTATAAVDLAGDHSQLPGGEIIARPPDPEVTFPGRGSTHARLTIPAMAVPMEAKTAFECPQDHLDSFRADLPNVKHVLIIGWRAAEPHAVELLRGSCPTEGLMPGYNLGIVSGSGKDADEVKLNLGDVTAKGRLRFEETQGFSAFINDMDGYLSDLLRA